MTIWAYPCCALGRELILDAGWCIGYDPRERWWGAEIEFPPSLDEVFGVPNNKQAATHFLRVGEHGLAGTKGGPPTTSFAMW